MTEKTIYTVFIRGYYCTEALKILLQLIFHIQNGTDSFNKVASPSGSSGATRTGSSPATRTRKRQIPTGICRFQLNPPLRVGEILLCNMKYACGV